MGSHSLKSWPPQSPPRLSPTCRWDETLFEAEQNSRFSPPPHSPGSPLPEISFHPRRPIPHGPKPRGSIESPGGQGLCCFPPRTPGWNRQLRSEGRHGSKKAFPDVPIALKPSDLVDGLRRLANLSRGVSLLPAKITPRVSMITRLACATVAAGNSSKRLAGNKMAQFLQRIFFTRGLDQAAPPILCRSLSGCFYLLFTEVTESALETNVFLHRNFSRHGIQLITHAMVNLIERKNPRRHGKP